MSTLEECLQEVCATMLTNSEVNFCDPHADNRWGSESSEREEAEVGFRSKFRHKLADAATVLRHDVYWKMRPLQHLAYVINKDGGAETMTSSTLPAHQHAVKFTHRCRVSGGVTAVLLVYRALPVNFTVREVRQQATDTSGFCDRLTRLSRQRRATT
jgi:hypothetical protein